MICCSSFLFISAITPFLGLPFSHQILCQKIDLGLDSSQYISQPGLHFCVRVPNIGMHSCLNFFLFGVLHRFQHRTGHITMGSWKGRGNQYIQFIRVLYCKLPTKGKQLPAFPLEAMPGIKPRPQRWEARVLPLCHRGPCIPA